MDGDLERPHGGTPGGRGGDPTGRPAAGLLTREEDLSRLMVVLREREVSTALRFDDVIRGASGSVLHHERVPFLVARDPAQWRRSLRVEWRPAAAVFLVPEMLAWPVEDPYGAARLIAARLSLPEGGG